ncbi:MAG: hypothetical protein IJM60_09285 [Bacteroidales bacterium]|nr:hypothetical protein [Bacteroidales bacterium]
MKKEKFDMPSLGKEHFRVPEGYFTSLKERLNTIPDAAGSPVCIPALRLRDRILPYVALAACFAFLLVVGNTLLRRTAGQGTLKADPFYDAMLADLIPVTNPYAVFLEAEEGETLSEEEIIDYLIQSGTTPEMLAAANEE